MYNNSLTVAFTKKYLESPHSLHRPQAICPEILMLLKGVLAKNEREVYECQPLSP